MVANRAELETRYAEVANNQGDEPARPAQWGGYRLTPVAVEFWQGRRNRLHDRLLYTRAGERWTVSRLAP